MLRFILLSLLTTFALVGPSGGSVAQEDCKLEECARAAVSAARSITERLNRMLPDARCARGQAVVWDGQQFKCQSFIRECRVCSRIVSNTRSDAERGCSKWTRAGKGLQRTPSLKNPWASGSSYATFAWIECR